VKTSVKLYVISFIVLLFSIKNTPVFSQEDEQTIITLEDINGDPVNFTKSELTELLCNYEWTYGYLYVNFLDKGIYESGVQESYEGKWIMDDKGDIHVEPRIEGEAENLLRFRSTYCLTDEYGTDVFYNDQYYNKYSVSKESKTLAEIELSEINEDMLSGIWVTDEQGPMGELLGFKFSHDFFYFGRPGLEIPFGCWEKVSYNKRGTWSYDDETKTIKIKREYKDHRETIEIKITRFYNEAFEGIISPDFIFDEVGDSERMFWKSECK
jgi:hypothetical protein